MTERDSIRFGGATIEYQVRRSARRKKTVQITVERGEVQVAAPLATTAEELRHIVLKRAGWLLRQLSADRKDVPWQQFIAGGTVPHLGQELRLMVETGGTSKPEVGLSDGTLTVALPEALTESDREQLSYGVLVEWYRRRAAEHLPDWVDRWWPRLGRGDKPRILVRNQKRRWGSCAWDGTLRFNWRVMLLEPQLVDLIVVHELAHLTVKNHSREFWKLVEEHLPDVKERRKRLRQVEAGLPW